MFQPHQVRVIAEKADLDTKRTALSNFIALGTVFPTLSVTEQELLTEQNIVMYQYSEILAKRIAAFTSNY